ncbi:uncharacterized protein LOC110681295 [Aedes aegypti]|uniref:Uncharacterized protein n=1 Tax=Aedes aegypti TaxID=7159 RepID=A0A6I8TTY5_AEDAE|nr:uncharacterized protein LOC110681295 [Aedes aegypti]XP_021712821.1 uncharacterized protein LOC110681295 [Aedes aegypti]
MTIMDGGSSGGVRQQQQQQKQQQQSQQQTPQHLQQQHYQQHQQPQQNQFGSNGCSPSIGSSTSGGTGQFPASFPDSFKDFFAMLNEEDDHVDVFSNILEDKDIPRSTKCRYNRSSNAASGASGGGGNSASVFTGGPAPHSASSYTGNRSFGLGFASGNSNYNFGRSSSFRLHRNKPAYPDHRPPSATVGFHSTNQQQQLLINNIRNQLGGSGSDLGFCGGSEEDKAMKNLSLIKSAIVDRSPSSSALAGIVAGGGGGGGLTVTGFPGPGGGINRSKSNSKIDDRSPTSFEMKNFVCGTTPSGSGAGRSYKISENSDEVEEDTLSNANNASSKNLSSKMTKTTTSYCFMRHHQQQQQQQQQQQSQQPTSLKPHHSRNNSLRVHRSKASASGGSISPSPSIASVFNQSVNKANLSGSCSSFSTAPGVANVSNCSNCGLPLNGNCCCSTQDYLQHQKSPIFNRRRSSSISVARPTPDLYRFLKTEIPSQQPLSPGARFEPRDKFPTLSTNTKGSTLASSTSTLSTLVESVSGVSTSTTEGANTGPPTAIQTNMDAIDAMGQSETGSGQPNGKLQQLNFNFGTMAPKDGAGGHLSSSPSSSRLKHGGGGGGGDGCNSAPPHSKSGRFQNEENDSNFSNQQQQQQSYHHHPSAHRTVSISTTAIVCGGGGRDGSRTPVPPGTGPGSGGGGGGVGGPGSTESARQRMRTSSMPVENRKPRLADTRRSAIHCADMDLVYYRLRSFSITSHGICNLGDSMRSRRSRSINSVTSAGSGGAKDRKGSSGSQKQDVQMASASREGSEDNLDDGEKEKIPGFKVAMLGASGVGKTALTYQFTTSEYICAYDLSLDDDYGQKTVSVLLDGQETDLEIIDHPACEMSEEAFCSTYHIDIFVVVYSVVDRGSFKKAEKILHFLKDSEMLLTRGVILVGNKTDLERQREVPTHAARRLAKEIGAKFIETSSGMDYNVDELLVGIVAQVKLNPQRINRLTDKQRNSIAGSIVPPVKTPIKGRKMAMSMRELPARDATSRIRRIVRRSSIGKFGSEDDDDYNLGDKRLRKKVQDFPDDDDAESDDERSTDNEMNLLHRKRYDLPSTSTQNLNSVNSRFLKRLSFDGQMQEDLGAQQQEAREQQRASPQPNVKRFNLIDDKSCSATGTAANKFANRTKLLLTSFLKFKRNLRVKRRSSGSCSDLFVI